MDVETAYQQALDYLYSFVDYSLTRNLHYTPEKFDLARMRDLMDRLGNPQDSYPIIHVAGTKGKGSTAAMIASGLQAAGYRVGFYTSPHLQEYTERIQVDRQEISKADLARLVDELRPHVAEIERLTTFEITTAAAFVYFQQQKVDVAVVEVGLGGRLDATNIITPLVSVITSLSMDHMNVLGDTLEKIAFEKAGIIKPGRPVVVAPQREEALRVVSETAASRNAALTRVGRDFAYAPLSHSLEGQSLQVQREGEGPLMLNIPLLGQHQVDNAATAFAALQVARGQGLNITAEQIQRGFAQVKWPGRFELLQRSPMLIIDSAHNRDSAMKLRFTLDEYLEQRPVVLIFGASEDKDVAGMFAELMPRVAQVVATQSVHPRAMPAEQIVELAQQSGRPAEAAVPVEAALKRALELAGSEAVVVAAGSLFLAAAVREVWSQWQTASVEGK